MISEYYLKKMEVDKKDIDKLNELIKPVNKKDEIKEINELLSEMSDNMEEPFEQEFDPKDYQRWLINNVKDDKEAEEELFKLTHEDVKVYDQHVRENIN